MLLVALADQKERYGIYHFTNEGRTSWYEFAREIYRQAREKKLVNRDVEIMPITTEEYPTRARRPRNSFLCKDKVKDAFGVSIRSWQSALSEHLDELKESQ